jgi:hypothetical protein
VLYFFLFLLALSYPLAPCVTRHFSSPAPPYSPAPYVLLSHLPCVAPSALAPARPWPPFLLQIDDPVDAIAVHLGCGMWGIIMTSAFAASNMIQQFYGPAPYENTVRDPHPTPHPAACAAPAGAAGSPCAGGAACLPPLCGTAPARLERALPEFLPLCSRPVREPHC